MNQSSSGQKLRLSASSGVSGSIDVDLPILSRVRITASDRGLTGLDLISNGEVRKEVCKDVRKAAVLSDHTSGNPALALLEEAARQLVDWFARKRMAFDLPLDVRGTAFQRSVWDALLRIPCGTTRTYGELAREICRPGAARAVGRAAAANPLPIVIPCHRLVAKSGLGGFSLGNERPAEPDGGDGSGAPFCSLGLKKRLLEFEKGREA